MDDRTPTLLLTGFLGSGKTTLLNAWLRGPALSRAAVIVNEFGDIGIDHELIASSNDNTIELSTGCLCCTVSGDLVDTLRELHVKRERGEIRPFDRVVIETTGLADPAPVIQALMTFPVSRRFRLGQIVTTVDAVNGMATLERYGESAKQVAVADALVLTKVDVDRAPVDELTIRLRRLNPGALLHTSAPNRAPSLGVLITADVYDPTTKVEDVVRWISLADHGEVYADGWRKGAHRLHASSRHGPEIDSFYIEYTEPLHWEHVATWLDALVMAHAEDILRVKGIVDVVGRRRPIVVQAVQHLFHPPFELSAWPLGERRSRIVFITRNLSSKFVREVLDTIRERPVSAVLDGTIA